MQFARYGDHYVVRLDEGEEAMSALRGFLVQHEILGGYFLAWGAFRRLTLEYYRPSERSYLERAIDKQVEVASLMGNIATLDGKPIIHAHMVVGDEAFQTYSGHLREGTVGPMLEVFVTPFPRELRRIHDERRNLAMLDLEEAPEATERIEAWP